MCSFAFSILYFSNFFTRLLSSGAALSIRRVWGGRLACLSKCQPIYLSRLSSAATNRRLWDNHRLPGAFKSAHLEAHSLRASPALPARCFVAPVVLRKYNVKISDDPRRHLQRIILRPNTDALVGAFLLFQFQGCHNISAVHQKLVHSS